MRAPPCSSDPAELFSRPVIEDPHPFFARLRREHPISRVGDTGVHIVATWDLVEEALAREADFSANLTGLLMRDAAGRPAVFELPPHAVNAVIATADEPEHAVHRGRVQPRLAPGPIAGLEASLRRWTREALAPWLSDGGGDFAPVSELVPARAVAHLLGLPGDDVKLHRQWAMMGGDMLAGDVSPEQLGAFGTETGHMAAYLRRHLEAAKRSPRTEPDAPLLHTLARGVLSGDLDDAQAVGISIVLFGAGGESTAALIGSTLRLLAGDPETFAALRADPALVPRFVEETVRLESPLKFHYRVVRRPCTLGGAALEPGDRLMLSWASANRDEKHFEAPDALRLDRRHPKQHMSFGRGAHFCVGATLARLEARVMLEELLARVARLRPGGKPVHARSIFVRRLEHLPIDIEVA